MDRFKYATIEDLQIQPAFSVLDCTPMATALELAEERDFSQVTIIDSERRLVGYVDLPMLQAQSEANSAVSKIMKKFERQKRYQIITPDTQLVELDEFLARGNPFAIVTDTDRKFVLGIATRTDLDDFVDRRSK